MKKSYRNTKKVAVSNLNPAKSLQTSWERFNQISNKVGKVMLLLRVFKFPHLCKNSDSSVGLLLKELLKRKTRI